VTVSSNRAYLAGSSDGMHIYDVTYTGWPTHLGRTTNSNSGGAFAYDVDVSTNHAFLANGTDGLRIYDISNPTNPACVGHAQDGGTAFAVRVFGNYAFLGSGDLQIYDISNPANPLRVAQVSTGGSPHCFALSGPYLYVANYLDGLRIYRILGPKLELTVSSTNTAVFSWAAPSTGFLLQENLGLTPSQWTEVADTPVPVAGKNQLVLPLTNQYRLFRLSLH
jgi:hypothetical protein